MNRVTAFALVIASAAAASGCASTTIIRSTPSGAIVKSTSGVVLGKTPYEWEDTDINGTRHSFIVEAEGREPVTVNIRRDDLNPGRAVGFGLVGFFCPPVWAGLLWAQDYEPYYDVVLPEQGAKTSSYVRAE